MINIVLSALSRQMEQYIRSFVHQPEGVVEVGVVAGQGEEEPCKIQLFLLNVEQETTTGGMITKGGYTGAPSGVRSTPLCVNLNVVIASVFTDKRYKDSLSFLSLALTFLQSISAFSTDDGFKYSIELMSPSLQDQSNIWTLFGGKYYPSVVCKIRRLVFDSNEIKRIEMGIRSFESNVGL